MLKFLILILIQFLRHLHNFGSGLIYDDGMIGGSKRKQGNSEKTRTRNLSTMKPAWHSGIERPQAPVVSEPT